MSIRTIPARPSADPSELPPQAALDHAIAVLGAAHRAALSEARRTGGGGAVQRADWLAQVVAWIEAQE